MAALVEGETPDVQFDPDSTSFCRFMFVSSLGDTHKWTYRALIRDRLVSQHAELRTRLEQQSMPIRILTFVA